MARDSGGSFSLPTGNPVVTGTRISSVVHNNTMSDIATEMTDSLSRSGKGGMLAPLRCTDGTKALPAYSFTNDTNTGIYRQAADKMALVVGGAVHEVWQATYSPPHGFSPMNYDAVGDGTTDDTTPVASAITAAQAVATLFSMIAPGVKVVIDLGGRCYGITSSRSITGNGIVVRNGSFKAISTLTSTQYMFSVTGSYSGFENVAFNAGKICRAVSLGGTGSFVGENCYVYNFKTYGIVLSQTDAHVSGAVISEWLSSDTEFTSDANFTAYGILVNHADVIIRDSIIRWCDRLVHGNSAADTCDILNCHLYNGGSGLVNRIDPYLIYWDTGAGALNVNGCYLDNGKIYLKEDVVHLSNNRALYNSSVCTITEFITLVYNGQTGPYRFRSDGWQIVSPSLTDGTIPFIQYSGAWSGTYTLPISNGSYDVEASARFVVTAQYDTKPNIVYYSPGLLADGRGAKIAVADADTTLTDLADMPGMWSSKNHVFLHRQRERTISSTDAAYSFLEKDSGRPFVYYGTTNKTLTLPADAPAGAFVPAIIVAGTGDLTVAVAAGGTLYAKDAVAPFVIKDQFARCSARCLSNADGVSAVWVLEGLNQPVAAQASLSAAANNVTGNGGIYKVKYDTLVYDTTSSLNMATGEYTCPSDGTYEAWTWIYLLGLTAGTHIISVTIKSTSDGVKFVGKTAQEATEICQGAKRLQCSAGDKIWIEVLASSGAATVDVYAELVINKVGPLLV